MTESTALDRTGLRRLTAAELQGLAEVPPEAEWFANLRNPNTRRAYRNDLRDFTRSVGIERPEEFRTVTRAHVIAWRRELEDAGASPATVRRKLAALSSLFNHLCDANAVATNPVHGVSRPNEGSNESKTPAISNGQAARILEAPPADTLKGKRDRAILSVLLFHGLRREELVSLQVRDLQERAGIPTFVVPGKGDKIRYVPVEVGTVQRIRAYLEEAGHGDDREGPLFRRVKGRDAEPPRHPASLSSSSIAQSVVKVYAEAAGVDPRDISPHALRATAAANAIEGGADLEEVREWLGHASVATTVLYDKRRHRPGGCPTFKVDYRRR